MAALCWLLRTVFVPNWFVISLTPGSSCCEMDILYLCKDVLKIQKFRRLASYAGFYSFTTLVTYAYTSNTYVPAELPFFTDLQCLATSYSYLPTFFSPAQLIVGQGLAFRGLISIMTPTLLVLSYLMILQRYENLKENWGLIMSDFLLNLSSKQQMQQSCCFVY